MSTIIKMCKRKRISELKARQKITMTGGKYEKCADGRITWIYISLLESKEDNGVGRVFQAWRDERVR